MLKTKNGGKRAMGQERVESRQLKGQRGSGTSEVARRDGNAAAVGEQHFCPSYVAAKRGLRRADFVGAGGSRTQAKESRKGTARHNERVNAEGLLSRTRIPELSDGCQEVSLTDWVSVRTAGKKHLLPYIYRFVRT